MYVDLGLGSNGPARCLEFDFCVRRRAKPRLCSLSHSYRHICISRNGPSRPCQSGARRLNSVDADLAQGCGHYRQPQL